MDGRLDVAGMLRELSPGQFMKWWALQVIDGWGDSWRQAGTIAISEIDEGAFYLGLMAAAHRVPFYPTRAGLGSDMLPQSTCCRVECALSAQSF